MRIKRQQLRVALPPARRTEIVEKIDYKTPRSVEARVANDNSAGAAQSSAAAIAELERQAEVQLREGALDQKRAGAAPSASPKMQRPANSNQIPGGDRGLPDFLRTQNRKGELCYSWDRTEAGKQRIWDAITRFRELHSESEKEVRAKASVRKVFDTATRGKTLHSAHFSIAQARIAATDPLVRVILAVGLDNYTALVSIIVHNVPIHVVLASVLAAKVVDHDSSDIKKVRIEALVQFRGLLYRLADIVGS